MNGADNQRLAIVVVGAIVLVDLFGAVVVSLFEHRVPQVMGDIAKVGVGALAMAAGTATRAGQTPTEGGGSDAR